MCLPAAVALLAACAVGPYVNPIGPVPIARSSLDAFAPLVPTSSAAGHCERGDRPDGEDGHVVSMAYAPPDERRVTVMLDAEGVPIRYTDVRGDLGSTDNEIGERTTIGLYLVEEVAYASNRPSLGEPVVLEIPYAEALSSERLGNPKATMEQVLTTCWASQ